MPVYLYVLPEPNREESAVEKLARTKQIGERGWNVPDVQHEAERLHGKGGCLLMDVTQSPLDLRSWRNSRVLSPVVGGHAVRVYDPDDLHGK